MIRILTIVLKEGRSERGYNPETPSNFWNNPKATPLDDTPTEAGTGVCLPSGEAALASSHDRH